MAIITALLTGILASLIATVIFLLFRERFVKIARYYYKRGDYVVLHLGYETKLTNIDDETVDVKHIINYVLVGLENNYKNFYVEFSSDAALGGMLFWHPDGSEIPIREIIMTSVGNYRIDRPTAGGRYGNCLH